MTPTQTPRLHVLTLEDLAFPTGQQARLVNLLPELARFFELVLIGRPGPLPPMLAEIIAGRIELPLPPGIRPLKYLLHPMGPVRWRRIMRALAKLPVGGESLYCESLILAALAAPSRPKMIAAEVNGIANEEMLHKLGPTGSLVQGWLKSREREGLQVCGHVVAVSEGIADYLRQLAPQATPRISVIGNGIDPHVFHAGVDGTIIRRQLELCRDPVAVMHSTFRPWHGIGRLLEAWAVVVGECPRARLLLIGDGLGLEEARNQALDLDLGDNVIFPGAIAPEDIPMWLAAADVGVYFPEPWIIGCPIKLFEFMAVGLPVVTVNDNKVAGAVSRAGAGILAEPRSEPFARAILDLFNDPRRRAELGRKGAAYASMNFTWKMVAEKISALLNDRQVM